MTVKLLIGLVILAVTTTGFYHTLKPLPPGFGYEGTSHPLTNARLLTDRTLHFGNEEPRLDHEIFDEALDMVSNARRFVLVDMFLFNGTRAEGSRQRPLAQELTDALLKQRKANPDVRIVVISDPVA